MTPDELLKPRYKVIADYPTLEQDNWDIGDVINPYNLRFVFPDQVNDYLSKYPHLFKKLEWWEEREKGDINYVKYQKKVYKVKIYMMSDRGFADMGNRKKSFGWGYGLLYLPECTPATEEEYLNQNK